MQDRSGVADAVTRACTASAGTVQALAEEVGVSYAALCSWSRARRQPPPHRLRKLADVLESRAERLRDIAGELRALAADAAPVVTIAAGERAAGLAAVAGESQPAGVARPQRSWSTGLADQARAARERAAAPLVDARP
jgi:transcriptional regulator with XRE-family HTH domain